MGQKKGHAPSHQVPPAEKKSERFAFRLTKEEAERLKKLGGINWIREQINKEGKQNENY